MSDNETPFDFLLANSNEGFCVRVAAVRAATVAAAAAFACCDVVVDEYEREDSI